MSNDLSNQLRSLNTFEWMARPATTKQICFDAADRIEKLEAALREMLEKCTWAKREKWCGSLDCHCQIARKALEGNDD